MSPATAASRFRPAAFEKASTSSRLGGSPVRSKLIRRIKVRASAGGAAATPATSSRARMNRSMSVFTQCVSFTLGGTTATGRWKAQCLSASGGGCVAAAAARGERTRANKHRMSELVLRLTAPAGDRFEIGAELHSARATGRQMKTKSGSHRHSGWSPILPNTITTPLLTALRQQLNLCSEPFRTASRTRPHRGSAYFPSILNPSAA